MACAHALLLRENRPSCSFMVMVFASTHDIYRVESGKPVFSILTRDPADSIAFIHNRMPVILPSDLVKDWINLRYKAEDILNHAVLTLSHEREHGTEQIQMMF